MKNIINNQNGHGQIPSGKDILKIIGGILLAPIALPVIIIKKKLKERKEKKVK
jgi:hypothetical protein